ncbi:spermatogenesis-defective protein 39 homolog [Salarias fasciatus]|uniref:spermatogenesis-defective protein 39 homolog n=1 Tax=Salarias fasciatus TaxID=181472 RepID=UPI0011767B2C|nr:spermatogenesis-defective protein 39 homolog [Salarias fasciatus]
MMKKSEEDEYWNSSKFRAFTFDDEDDEFSRLKESRQAIRRLAEEDEDEDEVEKVSWSGEPIGSISWSVKETESVQSEDGQRARLPQNHHGHAHSEQEPIRILPQLPQLPVQRKNQRKLPEHQ